MSVTNVNVPKPLQITQGLITKACAIFVSTIDIPIGTEIKVDPALFIKTPNSLDIGSYYYSVNYPATDNTTNRNINIVKNNINFKIFIFFIA